LVPDKLTATEFTVVQKGPPVYEMVAVGTAVTATDAVAVIAAQPPAAAFV
jgi:hypothetical protein